MSTHCYLRKHTQTRCKFRKHLHLWLGSHLHAIKHASIVSTEFAARFLFACVQISFCFAVLSAWWRCFLNLQRVCPFACVFFLRCPLSSQGHRTVSASVIYGTPECKHLVPFGEYFSPTQPVLDWWLSPNVCVVEIFALHWTVSLPPVDNISAFSNPKHQLQNYICLKTSQLEELRNTDQPPDPELIWENLKRALVRDPESLVAVLLRISHETAGQPYLCCRKYFFLYMHL